MSGYTLAQDLTETIVGQLDTGDHDLLVTLDPAEAGAALDGSTVVVIVLPPRTTHVSTTIADHAFEVLTIGPVIDPVTAWPILDPIAAELARVLEADETRLTLYQPAHGDAWPCAVTTLTLTTH